MKKFIAILLSALIIFSISSVAVTAEETTVATVTTTKEEKTTRNILNPDGLVVPINFPQLESSFIFKIFEKIFTFILSLFGGGSSGPADEEVASAIKDAAEVASEALSEAMSFVDGNQ